MCLFGFGGCGVVLVICLISSLLFYLVLRLLVVCLLWICWFCGVCFAVGVGFIGCCWFDTVIVFV